MRQIKPSNSLRRPVVFSAIIHIAIILFLIYAPQIGLQFSANRHIKKSTIWVELPRGTSDEIGMGMKKAKSLPKSTIEEQKKLFQPKSPKQESLKPKMTAPPASKKTKKGNTISKRPKISAKTTRKNKPRISTMNRKMRDALAKIDKELKGRTIVPESAQIKADQNGYKYGTGTKPLKVLPSDPEYIKYQAMVRTKIIREWIVPLKFMESTDSHYSARLSVMIDVNGNVISIGWEGPSGNATFDQSAVRAIKKASPFPKPPDRLAWEAYHEGFLVEFDPRLKSRY